MYPFYMHSNVILVAGFLPKGLTSEQPNRRSELCPSLAAPNFDKAASGISSERDAGKSMGNPWESPIDIWENPRKRWEKKHWEIQYWLVVEPPTPLKKMKKKMSSSVGMMTFPIYGTIKKFQTTNQL